MLLFTFVGLMAEIYHSSKEVMRQDKDLLWTDPDELLGEDRCLLKTSFDAIGAASAVEQEYWVV